MDWSLSAYDDPLFWSFPVMTLLVGMGAFVLFAAPLTWIAAVDPPSLRRFRIQSKRKKADAIIGPSIGHFLRNNAALLALVVLAWPLLRLSGVHAGPWPPWWEVAWQFVFFVYLDDFLFYWLHRGLHTRPLYRRIHVVHHRMPAPWACAGNYMHTLEFVAIGLTAFIGPLVVGGHVLTLWIWAAWRQWEAAEGHSGYSFPINPGAIFPGYGGTEYHDFHHAKFTGNYAGFLGYLDRIFGTTSPGYLEHMAAKRETQRP